MKKPKLTITQCDSRIQAVVEALLSESATREMIVNALVTWTIEVGLKDRRAEHLLGSAGQRLSDAAYDAFEQAKKDRAAKRRKAFGLPEE